MEKLYADNDSFDELYKMASVMANTSENKNIAHYYSAWGNDDNSIAKLDKSNILYENYDNTIYNPQPIQKQEQKQEQISDMVLQDNSSLPKIHELEQHYCTSCDKYKKLLKNLKKEIQNKNNSSDIIISKKTIFYAIIGVIILILFSIRTRRR